MRAVSFLAWSRRRFCADGKFLTGKNSRLRPQAKFCTGTKHERFHAACGPGFGAAGWTGNRSQRRLFRAEAKSSERSEAGFPRGKIYRARKMDGRLGNG